MFFSSADKGQMSTMIYNWPSDDVHAIVLTDGSRILGLGDLGANGLGVSIGKMDLYVGAGGFDPRNILPCVLDVGTNNKELREDHSYMGMKHPRITGDDYFDLIDEFVSAATHRWPNVVLQFEDFSSDHARVLLDRYRDFHCVFNDDIQGTAAAATAGIFGAMQVKGKSVKAITEERIVVVGAGSAGVGVSTMLVNLMEKYGLVHSEAVSRLYLLDVNGLITPEREDLEDHIKYLACRDGRCNGTSGCSTFSMQNILRVSTYMNRYWIRADGQSLVDVIKKVKPTVLLGLSGAGPLFTDEVIELMSKSCDRPIIMPMSNPTSRMECTHEAVRRICGERAIFACGSPQPEIEIGDKKFVACQANNMYIFPGLALAAHICQGNTVSDNMIEAASRSLVDMITPSELVEGKVYPDLNNIRQISLHVAENVTKAAYDEGHVVNPRLLTAISRGDVELKRYIKSCMFWPQYRSLVSPR